MILNPPDRFHILCAIGKQTTANQMAAAWDPAPRGDLTFGAVRLSPTGAEPATHLGCSTVADAGMRTGIEQALTSVPFAAAYREGDGWTWEAALADAGLQTIIPSEV